MLLLFKQFYFFKKNQLLVSSELSAIKTLFTKGESVIPLNEQIPIQLSKFLILYLLKDQTNKFSIFPKYWIRDKTYLILSLKQQAIELPVKSLCKNILFF